MSLASAAEPLGGLDDGGEIVGALGQAQQRQRAVGMARAQPVERLAGTRQRGVEIAARNAVAADALVARVLDRLRDGHGGLRTWRRSERQPSVQSRVAEAVRTSIAPAIMI